MRYPIAKMLTPDHYVNADDELSMEDNNTSGYNCRDIPDTDRTPTAAQSTSTRLSTRTMTSMACSPRTVGHTSIGRRDPGLLHDGDQTVLAFTDRGWTWGGHWTDPIDCQHFELP